MEIFEKIQIEPGSGCWLWQGAKTAQGYPTYWVRRTDKQRRRCKKLCKARGTQLSVRQLMFIIAKGYSPAAAVNRILAGKAHFQLVSTCGVLSCVNPDHFKRAPLISDEYPALLASLKKLKKLNMTDHEAARLLIKSNLRRWAFYRYLKKEGYLK